MTPKAEAYAALVTARKACRLCPDLTNPADVDGGRHDSDHVGPWSRWQSDLDATLMVVGQDWGDVRDFVRRGGRDGPGNPTNLALAELLRGVGVSVGPPGAGPGPGAAFFTNAILCLKRGGLQAPVRDAWFRNCASHLRRQIEIVRPRVVVGLGARAFGGVLAAFGLPPRPLRVAVADPDGVALPTGARAFAVYHPGARVLNTHRGLQAQREDWVRIARFLAAESSSDTGQ
jgi:uracil-DNA glycosylase